MSVKDVVSVYIYGELEKGYTKATVMAKTKKKFPEKSHAEIRGKLNTCLFINELNGYSRNR